MKNSAHIIKIVKYQSKFLMFSLSISKIIESIEQIKLSKLSFIPIIFGYIFLIFIEFNDKWIIINKVLNISSLK